MNGPCLEREMSQERVCFGQNQHSNWFNYFMHHSGFLRGTKPKDLLTKQKMQSLDLCRTPNSHDFLSHILRCMFQI